MHKVNVNYLNQFISSKEVNKIFKIEIIFSNFSMHKQLMKIISNNILINSKLIKI